MWFSDPSGEFVRVILACFLIVASPVLGAIIGARIGWSRRRAVRGAVWGALGTIVAVAAVYFVAMVVWQASDPEAKVDRGIDGHRESNRLLMVFAGVTVAGGLTATVAVRLVGDSRRKAKRWSSQASRDDITNDLGHPDGGPTEILL